MLCVLPSPFIHTHDYLLLFPKIRSRIPLEMSLPSTKWPISDPGVPCHRPKLKSSHCVEGFPARTPCRPCSLPRSSQRLACYRILDKACHRTPKAKLRSTLHVESQASLCLSEDSAAETSSTERLF